MTKRDAMFHAVLLFVAIFGGAICIAMSIDRAAERCAPAVVETD